MLWNCHFTYAFSANLETIDAQVMQHANVQPDEVESLGEFIRLSRDALAWSQRDLAYKADVDQATVNRIENGEVENPRPTNLRRIAQALGVQPEDLFGLAGYVESDELPPLPVYLRTKYGRQLSPTDQRALARWIKVHSTELPNEEGGLHEKIRNEFQDEER